MIVFDESGKPVNLDGDAPTEAASASGETAGVEVLWEGNVPAPEGLRLTRILSPHQETDGGTWERKGRWLNAVWQEGNLTACHLARLLTAAAREKAAAVEAVLAVIESEPELEGEPPAAILEELRRDPVGVLRSTVRATKASIARRARAALEGGAK